MTSTTKAVSVRAPLALGLLVLVTLAGCAAPADSDAETAPEVAVEDGASTTSLQPPVARPDFVALAYSQHAGCRDAQHKFHYRFYLKNQGTAAGAVPMSEVHINVPWSDNGSLLDFTTYVWNTQLAAGETKLIDIVIPYNIYPTTYQAEVAPDAAHVVKELNETNNDLIHTTPFWNGLQDLNNCL